MRLTGAVEEVGPAVPGRTASSRFDLERRAATLCGLTPEALRQLRSLIGERGRNSWTIGDALVKVYGRPPAPGVIDGSRARLDALADQLGVSVSWLTAARITSAAWPTRDRRPTLGWIIHRMLAARPNRRELLDAFADHCRRHTVTASRVRLDAWLDEHAPTTSTAARPGRPRLDPIERIARQALALNRHDLARLVARLQAELAAAAA